MPHGGFSPKPEEGLLKELATVILVGNAGADMWNAFIGMRDRRGRLCERRQGVLSIWGTALPNVSTVGSESRTGRAFSSWYSDVSGVRSPACLSECCDLYR